jgi:hypothetical protein
MVTAGGAWILVLFSDTMRPIAGSIMALGSGSGAVADGPGSGRIQTGRERDCYEDNSRSTTGISILSMTTREQWWARYHTLTMNVWLDVMIDIMTLASGC